jgi:hypothetical protein
MTEESGAKSSNGNGRSGFFGVAAQAIRRLSPEFIAILILNIAVLGGLLWLFAKQSDARERVLAPLLEACAHSVPIEALKMLAKPNN